MFCQICGHVHKIDFWVPDEIWDEAIHPRFKNTHICLNCFMERADEKLLQWDKTIKLVPCSLATQIEIQKSVGFLNFKTDLTDEPSHEEQN